MITFNTSYSRAGQLSLHGGLVIGFLVLSTWAWNVICAPEVFAWYFGFTILNVGQLLYILYQMRPIRFDEDLESVYAEIFAPMSVSRVQFKRLVAGSSSVLASTAGSESTAQVSINIEPRPLHIKNYGLSRAGQ